MLAAAVVRATVVVLVIIPVPFTVSPLVIVAPVNGTVP